MPPLMLHLLIQVFITNLLNVRSINCTRMIVRKVIGEYLVKDLIIIFVVIILVLTSITL